MKRVHQLLFLPIIVLIAGCAGTVPPTVFLPKPESHVQSIYRNGVPIAIVSGDSSLFMLSAEPSKLSGKWYMRLWFLCRNNSDSPFLLEPLRALRLTIHNQKVNYDSIAAESPTVVLANIENEKAVSLIVQAIGGALQATTTQATTITGPEKQKYEVNDLSSKRQAVLEKTVNSMEYSSLVYDYFKSSINAGILRKNTIFPMESVNGYLYFPLPSVPSRSYAINPTKYDFIFHILTSDGPLDVNFSPAAGE